MTSHSFATLTKALGLSKSRKQNRPSIIRTSLSHASLFSSSTDDLSGSPRSAPPTRTTHTTLRHSKSVTNLITLGRTWSRKQRSRTADHIHFSAPPTPAPALALAPAPNPDSNSNSNARRTLTFTLERRSTSSTASSDRISSSSSSSTHYTTTRTANESIPHSSLPAQIWPRLAWDPSVDAEDIDLGLDGEDDHDNGPVFADFFQRLRDIEAELDLIEARGQK